MRKWRNYSATKEVRGKKKEEIYERRYIKRLEGEKKKYLGFKFQNSVFLSFFFFFFKL